MCENQIVKWCRTEQRLEELIAELLRTRGQVDFLVGRNGEFDLMAASVIRRVRQNFGEHSATLTLMLPYVTIEYRDNEEEFLRYYDSVEVFPSRLGQPRRVRIPLRNRLMVDRADAVICGIDHPGGGAYEAVLYARAQHKPLLFAGEMRCI